MRFYIAIFLILLTASGPLRGQGELFTFVLQGRVPDLGTLTALAFSPDNRLVAVGTADGRVGVLALAPFGTVVWLSNLGDGVTALSFAPGSRLLASGSSGGVVRLIDLGTMTEIERRAHRHRVAAITFSPKGEWLASAGADGDISVRSGRSLDELSQLKACDQRAPLALAFTNGERVLLSATAGGKICEWAIETQRLIRQIQDAEKSIASASVSVSGAMLALGTSSAYIHRAALNSPLSRPVRLPGGGTYSDPLDRARPSDVVEQNGLKIYDLRKGSVRKSIDGVSGRLAALSLSPDGRFVVASRAADKGAFLSVFDISKGVEIVSLPFESGLPVIALSRSGVWMGAGTGKGDLVVFRVAGVLSGDVELSSLDDDSPGTVVTSSRQPLIAPTAPTVIAIMDLDPLHIDADTSRAVTDMIRNRISGTAFVEIVERERLQKVLVEQGIQNSDRTSRDTAVKLGKILNAQKVIFGSISRLGTVYTINTQMADVETAKIDGIREVVCRKCELEHLPSAVAVLRGVLVGEPQ